MEVHWYFKLFNSIKEKHEVTFAQMELNSLFGNVNPVRNFSDILEGTLFSNFRTGEIRIQDYFAHELPYGECQGFFAKTQEMPDVSLLVMRLAYTREFFAATESDNPSGVLHRIFPEGRERRNVECFSKNGCVLLRFITNQYFLEKSQYISKLSRNEEEVSRNVESLFSFLTDKLYRIPATETMQIGKRLEDYFTIREEPSLYLTHYMHPYKGKFHPKMVRALLNYVFPKQFGRVMDNFAGCGTLLVEATWMGLDSTGVEINPLSALMCNVKCSVLTIPPRELKENIDDFLRDLRGVLGREKQSPTSSYAVSNADDREETFGGERKSSASARLTSLFSNSTLDHVIVALDLVKKVHDEKIRSFLLLALSGTISDLARRRKGEFVEVLQARLKNLYLRVCIFEKLNQVLKIRLGESRTYVADTRDMKMITSESIDAIVNSPPYSTALDYVKNDYPQLTLLKLADVSQLETSMIGSPRFKLYSQSLLAEIVNNAPDYANLPQSAKDAVSTLVRGGRTKEALRSYKFFKDMNIATKEMFRVLKRPSKCVVVIGNNHFKIDGNYAVVKNDEVIKDMALMVGFRVDRTIVRELEKSQAGMIRAESILVLEKPSV